MAKIERNQESKVKLFASSYAFTDEW